MVLTKPLLFRFITVFQKLFSSEMGQLSSPKIVDFNLNKRKTYFSKLLLKHQTTRTLQTCKVDKYPGQATICQYNCRGRNVRNIINKRTSIV